MTSERSRTDGGRKTEAARAALRVLAQRGVIRTWGSAEVEHMKAALAAARNARSYG